MKTNLVAAFRNPKTGEVTTGDNHADAFDRSSIKCIYEISERDLLASEGFSKPDGTHFMTRDQTNRKFGISMSEQLTDGAFGRSSLARK